MSSPTALKRVASDYLTDPLLLIPALLKEALAGSDTHPDAFVFGLQKAGTTFAAQLIATALGTSVTQDLLCERRWHSLDFSSSDSAETERLIKRNRASFSRGVVKEPNLWVLSNEIAIRYPESRLFVLRREPEDNVRSLLDRFCEHDDDPERFPRQRITRSWRRTVEVGCDGPLPRQVDLVGAFARLWTMVDSALDRIESGYPERTISLKYDSLTTPPEGLSAAEAARWQKALIALEGAELQPRGRGRGRTLEQAYGEAVARKVRSVVADRMHGSTEVTR